MRKPSPIPRLPQAVLWLAGQLIERGALLTAFNAKLAERMSNLHPSPAVVVRADASIADCVSQMRVRKVGSVLVVSDDGKESLLGIFTERDLVRRFELIQGGDHWQKPIRSVMTHPIVRLPIEDLAKGVQTGGESLWDIARLMLAHQIRHLPVVVRQASEGQAGYVERLAGVISMRDVFRALVESHTPALSAPPSAAARPEEAETLAVGLLTSDPFLHALLAQTFEHSLVRVANILRPDDLPLDFTTLSRYPALIYDLDGLKPSVWQETLKKFSELKTPPRRFLMVYTSERLSSQERAVLEAVSAVSSIHRLEKPLNVLTLLNTLKNA